MRSIDGSPLGPPNLFEQSVLYLVQDRVVLNDGEILHLGQKLFVGVGIWPKHLGSLRPHLAHLLSHLVRSYAKCLSALVCDMAGAADGW